METMPVCNNFVAQRLMLEELYPEPTTFGDCDCTSYSYLCLSLVLLSFGTFVTVASLSGGHGDGNEFIFSNMGHMWLIGPICISSGMMIAIKIILYLRRKSVIQMALRHGVLLSGCLDWLEEHVERMGSVVHNPPSYDLLMGASAAPFETPPPSYEDAVLLMNNAKSATSSGSCCSKEMIAVNNHSDGICVTGSGSCCNNGTCANEAECSETCDDTDNSCGVIDEENYCGREICDFDVENCCSSEMCVHTAGNCSSKDTAGNCCGSVTYIDDVGNCCIDGESGYSNKTYLITIETTCSNETGFEHLKEET